MLESGDWLVPRLNYLKYFEKPPLAYWATALSFALFGVNETTARLGAIAAALACLAGSWVLGRSLFDRRSAHLGAVFLALAPLTWVAGRLLLTDVFLSAGVVWALAGYALAVRRAEDRESCV